MPSIAAKPTETAGEAAAHVQVGPTGTAKGRCRRPGTTLSLPVHLADAHAPAMQKILAVITVSFSVAVPTFSQQTHESTEQAVATPMVLPSQGVTVTDIHGRVITVTVIQRDANGITIKLADGTEAQVAWSKLSAETVAKITGQTPKAAPVTLTREQRRAQVVATHARLNLFNDKYKKTPGPELLKSFKEGEPEVSFYVDFIANGWANWASVRTMKDLTFPTRYGSPKALLDTLEIKEGDEQVSLRKEFERLGVVAHQQEGNTCVIHAAYHMYQYALKKEGMKSPSYDTFARMVQNTSQNLYMLKAPDGRQLFIQGLGAGPKQLTRELIKHQLRNGHPCMIRLQGEQHTVLAVGFTVKDGVTTFESLNSNRIWEDKGFRTTTPSSTSQITAGHGEVSAWFK